MGKFKKYETSIDGVYVIEPTVFGDERGYFMETYEKNDFEEIGITGDFVQDNQSRSKKGVLRGLHFQKNHSQAKIVRCIKGEVFDVENKKIFYIPRGFAHGFLVLSDVAEFCYKVDNIYDHESEGGLQWNDKDVNIEWPEVNGVTPEQYLTSEKDGKWPTLKELKNTNLFEEYRVK